MASDHERHTGHDEHESHSGHGGHGHASVASEPDYYAVLGVRPEASAEQIRLSFRRLAKLWHPDRYTTAPVELRERAERRMRSLTSAYDVIGDPITRHAYDRRAGLLLTVDAPATRWTTYPDMPMPVQSDNPNGAGQFAGLLCLILAFALGGRLAAGGLDGWEMGILITFVIGLAALAFVFFAGDSPAAAKAREWAEGSPSFEPWHPPTPAYTSAQDDDLATFEILVEDALAGIPAEFAGWLENVAVRVEDEPSAETLRTAGVGHGSTLLGLYVGVPLTAAGAGHAGPEVVTLFRKPIERVCDGDPDLIQEQVRATVLHELAHHFGIDHEEMPDWVK